ncbi:hypothetical protein FHL15_006573 [Xylaria flabelliformis]|uniref:Autophagy-related protein n=1 Tax=Xylaria flabelliformis TaxID=2512241 RepID=A0A553HXG5_9PEZI|nr:hypothetical protein FHL15_006573 [Xylaria flabelliformis]
MVAIKSLAAITALSFVHTAHAWYNDLPSCLTPFDPFVYTGCYDNGQPGQPEALSLRTDLDQQNMTVEICIAHCKGNSSETCGGDSEINIWMDPTFPPLGDQKSITEYVPVGCWTDDSSDGKALFYRQDNLDSSTLTTEKCLQSCLNGGFPFAGTEYVIGNGTDLATDASTCSMSCNGNSNETCGGPARLSLYVAKDLQSLEPCGTPPDTSSTITYPVSTTTPSSSSTKTPPSSSTTTTSAPVCTTTTVTPPSCEYKIGKWCSNPVPDWHDKKSCLLSWSQCALQSTSCFLKAGFPDALHCFEYAEWCAALDVYCVSKCSGSTCGGKSTFTQKYPPKGGNPPTTQTSTYPCPTTIATTTTKTTTTTAGYPTSSCPVPTPTGICIQPTNNKYHYGPGNPVGGIPLPIVTCNNIKDDWNAGNVFKLYTDNDSHKCPSYPRPSCPNACADACKTQFQQCESVYTEGCKSGSFDQQYKDADAACKAQYSDCLAINKNVKGRILASRLEDRQDLTDVSCREPFRSRELSERDSGYMKPVTMDLKLGNETETQNSRDTTDNPPTSISRKQLRRYEVGYFLSTFAIGPPFASFGTYVGFQLQNIGYTVGNAPGKAPRSGCLPTATSCRVPFAGSGDVNLTSYVLYLNAIIYALSGGLTLIISGIGDYLNYQREQYVVQLIIYGILCLPIASLRGNDLMTFNTLSGLYVVFNVIGFIAGAWMNIFIPFVMHKSEGSESSSFQQPSNNDEGLARKAIEDGMKMGVWGSNGLSAGQIVLYVISIGLTFVSAAYAGLYTTTAAGVLCIIISLIAWRLLPAPKPKSGQKEKTTREWLMLPLATFSLLFRQV